MKNQIAEQLQLGIESYPSRIALGTNKVSYTYSQLAYLIPRIATKLRAEGISGEARVGISLGLAADYLVSWALLWLGITSCSIQKGTPVEFGDFGIDWLISFEEKPEFDPKRNLVIDRLWFMEAEAITETIEPPVVRKNHVGRLCMTSGSTGQPKCVSFSFEYLENRAFEKTSNTNYQVRGSFFGPTIWVGFNRMLTSFSSGATLQILPVDDPKYLMESFELGLEEISGSPAQHAALLEALGPLASRFWSLKLLKVSGGLLTEQLKQRLIDSFGCSIEVRYSSTETGNVANAVITATSPKYFVGKIAHQGAVEIVDEAGVALVAGNRGQVRIKKPTMAQNYLNKSGELTPALRSEWFYPGDEGSLSESGDLFIFGRIGKVKNFGGVKIDLNKVEEFFCSLDGITDCVALTEFQDNFGVHRIVVALEVTDAFDLSASVEDARTQTFFSSVIDVIPLPTFPRSEMGKIKMEDLAQEVRNSKEAKLLRSKSSR